MTWVALLIFPAAIVVGAVLYSCGVDRPVWIGVGIAAALVFGVVNGCGYKPALQHSIETRSFHVKHKERVGGDNGKYLVFTDDGVFSVQDSFWLWKFDASDRYNEIAEGRNYRCKVAGWRIHFTSDYENLISCKAAS